MATATTMRPLVSLALPDQGAARLASQLFLALAGTLLLTLSAKTKVVLGPVDISLQTLAVLLIASAFGMRLAVATLLLYLAEGAFGLPVFQGTPEKGLGIAYILGSTGGYLAGFVVMAAIAG
ncbi:MAG: biotin transporter BioY, partial [Mesorhizobium sp.]